MIKKLIVLIAFVVFVSGTLVTASEIDASAESSNEISFRGVPWGADIETAESSINGGGYFLHFDEGFFTSYTDEILEINSKYPENVGTGCMSSLIGSSLKVAGYDVDDTWLYFAAIFKDNIVDYSTCSYSFYGAKYGFSFTDINGTASDLLSKLTDVYGGGYETIIDDKKTIYEWNGSNGTVCTLSVDERWEKIYIAYAWRGGDELIDKADSLLSEHAKMEESQIYSNGNTDGL